MLVLSAQLRDGNADGLLGFLTRLFCVVVCCLACICSLFGDVHW